MEDRNGMRGSATHYAFRVSSQGQVFFVWREGDRISSSVKFEWNDAGITVRNNENAVMLQARPVVNDDGECRLKLKDQELTFWQFRRRALDDLFFNF